MADVTHGGFINQAAQIAAKNAGAVESEPVVVSPTETEDGKAVIVQPPEPTAAPQEPTQ